MIVNRFSEIMGRQRKRISDIVRETGLARNTVADLYYDRTKMLSFETLDKLCKALDCQPGDLFEYKPNDQQTGRL